MIATTRPITSRWHGSQGKYDRQVALVETGGSFVVLEFTTPEEMGRFAAQLMEMAAKWERKHDLAERLQDSQQRFDETGSLR